MRAHGTPDARSALTAARRVVVKIGSALLVDRAGLRAEWLAALAADVAACARGGRGGDRVVRVDRPGPRGAGPAARPLALEQSQAAAAVGQIQLARAYQDVLGPAWHQRRAGAADAGRHA